MGKKGKSRLRKKRGGVALPPHAPPRAQANAAGEPTAKTGSEEEPATLRAQNASELAKARPELDNAQQRDDSEVVLPQETDLQGTTDEKAARPADDGPGELEREAPGSGEVVLPDEVEEPGLHGATAEEVVRPATEEADDVPVELEAGGSGEETPWPEKQKFKSLKAVMASSSTEDQAGKATDAPRAEEELPASNFAVLVPPTVDPEEDVVSLRARLAATEAENLRNKETVIELEKRLKEMSLSAADSSGSGTKSAQLPAAAAGRGRGRGKQQKKDNASSAAGAPDADQAHGVRVSSRGRLIIPNTRYSSGKYAIHGDAAAVWKPDQGRR